MTQRRGVLRRDWYGPWQDMPAKCVCNGWRIYDWKSRTSFYLNNRMVTLALFSSQFMTLMGSTNKWVVMRTWMKMDCCREKSKQAVRHSTLPFLISPNSDEAERPKKKAHLLNPAEEDFEQSVTLSRWAPLSQVSLHTCPNNSGAQVRRHLSLLGSAHYWGAAALLLLLLLSLCAALDDGSAHEPAPSSDDTNRQRSRRLWLLWRRKGQNGWNIWSQNCNCWSIDHGHTWRSWTIIIPVMVMAMVIISPRAKDKNIVT